MKIICYGDSNTYGYDPSTYVGSKYDKSWPEIIADKTGNKVESLAMPGKQIPFREGPLEAMKAQLEDVWDHADLLVIMLGSNDIEASLNVMVVNARMSAMLKAVTSWGYADRVLLVGPPPLKMTRQHQSASREMNDAFAKLAQNFNIEYVDSYDWPVELCSDKTHLTEADQEIFANQMIQAI